MVSNPSMRFHVATIVIAALFPLPVPNTAAGGQDWHFAVSQGLIKERVIGLLSLPEVVAPECAPTKPTRVNLYASPSTGRPPSGSIEPSRDCHILVRLAGSSVEEPLPTEESGYETSAAVVYQRDGRWFRIALQHGSAWVARDNPNDFLPYPEILTDRLSYVKEGWDGRMWNTPGASGAARALPSGWRSHLKRNIPIDFLGSRRVGNEMWIHVRLNTEICGQSFDGVTSVDGWVPAYSPSGAPSAWFYSRGC
jgi:hypothetical protein